MAGQLLEKRTSKTIITLRRLEVELGKVVRRGYAVDHEELCEGLTCVAAPVRDHAGEVVAAISVSLPRSRMTAARTAGVAPEVIRTAKIISSGMGFRAL